MNTADELMQQATHERRMRTDLEYATDHLKQETYEDLVNFIQFTEDYQMIHEVGRELLRALCNVDKRNGLEPILEAVKRIKVEYDAKIEKIAREKME